MGRARTGKRKSDALGKLLVAQQALDLLPGERAIAEFVARALKEIPGVSKAHVCLSAAPDTPRADFEAACRTCTVRLADGTPGGTPKCAISGAAGYRVFPLRTARGVQGYLPVRVGAPRAFARYAPHVENVSNVVASAIEGRRYLAALKQANEALGRARELLERTVAERTAQLAQSEEKYRLVFSSNLDAVSLIDADTWRYLEVNPAWAALYGYSRAEALAMTPLDISADPALMRTTLRESIAAGRARRIALRRHRNKTGAVFPVEVSGDWFELHGRRVIAMVARDISERLEAEEKLRAERDFSRAAVDSMFGVFYLIEESGRFLLWNRTFERLTGFLPEEIRTMHPVDFFTADEKELIGEKFREVFREGRTDVEAMLRAKSGGGIPFHFNAMRIEFEGKSCAIGMGIDISKRKEAESAAYLAASALANTAEGVMITGLDGRMISVNRGFTAITGYTEEEALGQTPRLLRSGRHDAAFHARMWEEIGNAGHWQGEIWNRRKNGEVYPELLSISAVKDAAGRVSHYVGVFNDISMYKAYEERLQFLATHDSLTRLPNRVLFQDRCEAAVARARRDETLLAVLYLDLDQFKNVNDSLGHSAGDRLLEAVARRLKDCVRGADTVARFGGDAFVVLAEELGAAAEAAVIAQKVLEALARPFEIEARELFVTAGIGISCFPRDGADPQALLRNADMAMFRAKEAGRGSFLFYTEELAASARERLALESGLRQALRRDEFVLHYQPRAELSSGRITGAEALVRWQHPEQGIISPMRFIPVAEETGLIEPLGEWVLGAACRQMAAWLQAGIPPFRMAVNLSARQLTSAQLLERVLEAAKDAGLDLRCLELEITESMLMQNPEIAQRTIAELHARGVTIAMDDFGTGYSSLSYLKRFRLDHLKIDRAFIRGLPGDADDVSIVGAIIAMAGSLGIGVIAEGVETEEQRAFLARAGCDEIQGYLLSKPRPAEELEALLRANLGGAGARG